MQLRRLLFLGLLLGAEAGQLVKRQNTGGSSAAGGGDSTPTAGNNDTPSAAPTTAGSGSTPTSPSDNNNTPTGGGGNGGVTSTPANNGGDTTVTRTTTVTDADAGTVSSKTTVLTTITSTVTVAVTEFKTTTVTSTDAETATKTIYETSTSWANQKRAINLAPRTVNPEGMQVDAEATDVPAVTQTEFNDVGLRHKNRRGNLEKRATITEFVTETVAGKGGKTAVNTVTNTVISTVSTESKTTEFVTETEQANAKTTVTVTSTLVVTSTAVTTGVVMTTTAAPSGAYGGAGTGVPQTGNGNDNTTVQGDTGLSVGAKAGIGAGCGVAALFLLGALIWLLKKRRNNTKAEHDDMFGSSEVPVGRSSPPPVSQHNRDAAAAIIAPRRAPTKPNNPEGYRGTAIGDGRTGYAKPEAFGSAYSAVSPETNYTRTTANTTPHPDIPEMYSPANTAELSNDSAAAKWHDSNAAEIDSTQVTRPGGTAPPPGVYEMPAQNYK